MDANTTQGEQALSVEDMPFNDTATVLFVERGPHELTPQEEEMMRHSLIAFYIFIFVVVLSQAALVHWKKTHRRSYELVTLVGLWLIPPIISLFGHFWRFLGVWAFFSGVTGYLLYKCTFERTIEKSLPKLIYRWFFTVFKVSVAIGSIGYVLLLITIFAFSGAVPPSMEFLPPLAFLCLWYGLYFGILTRDCAEVASDRIANRLGGSRRMAVSVRDCAICGGELKDAHRILAAAPRTPPPPPPPPTGGSTSSTSVIVSDDDGDSTMQLSCKHLFHKDCLRGWLIVGKKDTCPTCHERVDLRQLYQSKPWETGNLQWVQMLDFFRYLVVWQPSVLLLLHFVLHVLHLDDDELAGQDLQGEEILVMTTAR